MIMSSGKFPAGDGKAPFDFLIVLDEDKGTVQQYNTIVFARRDGSGATSASAMFDREHFIEHDEPLKSAIEAVKFAGFNLTRED